jgi:hypothetical protein
MSFEVDHVNPCSATPTRYQRSLPKPRGHPLTQQSPFTTLGYGDVVLTGNWRTLASIQAANGVIVFGWTTALIFVFIQRVYNKENEIGDVPP